MSEVIFGIHTIQSMLTIQPSNLKKIFILKSMKALRIKSLLQDIKQKKIFFEFVNRKWLDKKSKNQNHQGIIAYIKISHSYKEYNLKNIINEHTYPFFLVLDRVTDPHNLGACIRSANAAGVHAVIIPKNHSSKLTNIAKKVSSGASEYTPLIQVTNLSRTLRFLKDNNIFIFGSVINGNNTIFNSQMVNSIALVMGSEENGLRELTKKNCDAFITIPMMGNVASLNISVATGILLFEIVRQRGLLS